MVYYSQGGYYVLTGKRKFLDVSNFLCDYIAGHVMILNNLKFLFLILSIMLLTGSTVKASPVERGESLIGDTRAKPVRELVREGRYREALDLLSPYISEPLRYPRAVSDYIVLLLWLKKV